MNTTQTTLINTDTDIDIETDDHPLTTTPTTDHDHAPTTTRPTLAPPEQRGGEACCPWCLAAPETFDHRENGRIQCGYCDAAIPVGTDWYERGEKIVI